MDTENTIETLKKLRFFYGKDMLTNALIDITDMFFSDKTAHDRWCSIYDSPRKCSCHKNTALTGLEKALNQSNAKSFKPLDRFRTKASMPIPEGAWFVINLDDGKIFLEELPKASKQQSVVIEENNKVDFVNHPAHYNTGKIEVIEFIEDQKLNYHLGNTVKYVARAGKKDPTKEIEDLEKAAWYLKRRIEELKAKREDRPVLRPNEMGAR